MAPDEDRRRGGRNRQRHRGDRDAKLRDGGVESDQEPFERKGGKQRDRQLSHRAQQEQVRRGRDRRACRGRFCRLLHREKYELDGEQGAEQAQVRRPAGDRVPPATSGRDAGSTDHEETREQCTSAQSEACLGEYGEVRMNASALHGVRRRAELQLIDEQMSQLRQNNAESDQ